MIIECSMGKIDNQVFYGENRKMWNVGGRGTQDVIVNGMTMAGGHLKGDIWAKTWIDSGNILRTFQIEPRDREQLWRGQCATAEWVTE